MAAVSNEDRALHQSTAASTWCSGPRPRLGWVEMAVGLPEALSYPGISVEPFFCRAVPQNDRRRAAHSFSKNQSTDFSFFFYLFHVRLRLFILLLLLMSGNVHPNPGPIFPCSVCAGNVTLRDKSVQGCTFSKWVYLRCSLLFLSKFKTLDSSHSRSSPLLRPCW